MKLTGQSFLLTLSEDIQIGELKATLTAQVMGEKNGFDIEFIDIDKITYMGIPIDGYANWKKFKAFHLEMGIDWDKLTDAKFDEIFKVDAVKKLIKDVKF